MTRKRITPAEHRVILQLSTLRLRCEEIDSLRYLLSPLQGSIQRSYARVAEAEVEGSPDYLDAVVEDECGMVEETLGVAFVACQARLTGIVSAAQRLGESARAASKPVSLPINKRELLALGERHSEATDYSFVALVDGFANYYKHRDEWRTINWEKLDSRQLPTAQVISAVGACAGSTGNLRRGAEAIGVVDLQDLSPLARVVERWAEGILRRATREPRAAP